MLPPILSYFFIENISTLLLIPASANNSNNFISQKAIKQLSVIIVAIEKIGKKLCKTKFDLLSENNIQLLLILPSDFQILESQWVYKIKYRSTGKILHFKACQAVKIFNKGCFTQQLKRYVSLKKVKSKYWLIKIDCN